MFIGTENILCVSHVPQTNLNSCGDRQFSVLFCNILANLLQIPVEFVLDESNHNVNPQYHANTYVYLTSPFLIILVWIIRCKFIAQGL